MGLNMDFHKHKCDKNDSCMSVAETRCSCTFALMVCK